ncbi:3-deoxy-D-manno-octulosonic acid transferase, partial [Rhodomicrobium udaipurense JA643]
CDPANPYEIALSFCMERLQRWLRERNQVDRTTHVIVERRGAAEDTKLELEFRRIADGRNPVGRMPNLDIRFMDKKHNSTGLQIADLTAHPIGRHVINPTQQNRAFELIEPKLRRGPNGRCNGYGLKIFP